MTMSPTANLPSFARRLQAELTPLVDRFLEVANTGRDPVAVIEPRLPSTMAPFHHEVAAHYKEHEHYGVQFFIYSHDYNHNRLGYVPDRREMFDDTSRVDEVLKKACITHNRCKNSMAAFWPAITTLVQGHRQEIAFVTQESQIIQPRLVMFAEDELSDEDFVPPHDFFVFNGANGHPDLVFDPTGYQFGFPKFLYTYAEYKEKHLMPGTRPHVVDKNLELLVHQEEARFPRADWVRKVLRLRDKWASLTQAELKAGLLR